jgi:putative PEP-CTERM system TPR-repeat lipoprotein
MTRIVAAHPQSADALLLQGTLRIAQGDRSGARTSLEAAIAADPSWAPARLELIALLIVDSQFDAATEQIDAARKLRGQDLRLVYFDALVAMGRKDLPKARELSAQLLKSAPDHVPTLVLAGSLESEQKQWVAAEAHLQKALLLAPEHDGARRALVRAYMSTNQAARALDTVQPLLAPGRRVDPATLMLAGEVYLANGDIRQASTYFASATESKPQETAARIRLGQIAMLSGDPERGIKELEAASAIEGAPMQADLALIAGYMRRNESAKALEAATALAKKLPREPIAFQVLGAVQAARKDFAAARASFAQALALDPTYLPAVQSLARLDLADRKPADARARFEAVLAKEPNNELALLGLADVMATTRAPAKEIVPVLQRAIAAKPNSAAARLALIRLYLQEKDGRAALTAAQEASVALPGDRRVLDALGLAQMAAGEHNQAIESFTRLAAQQPDSVQPLMRLAAAYASAKETDKSIDVLLRAQKLAPADPSIRRELALGYLTTGKVDQALSQARGLQSAAPKSASGFLLEGDIFAASLQWTQAERAYRDALKAEPASGVTVAKLHGALVAAGRKADADSMARKWLAEHPTEVGLRLYLAEQSLRVKDYKSAVSYYQVVVKEQPDNVAALNNLAWAAGQLGDPKAIGYAERALKLAPDSPLVLDTVGVLVAAAGDANRGVEYLARAVTLAPDRPDIRFNYAKALMKAGKTEQARKELTQLQAVEQDFSGKSEVAGLLKQLP